MPATLPQADDASIPPDGAPPASDGRLRLRRFTPADEDALVQMHSDPRVRELLVDDVAFDQRQHAANFLARLQDFYLRHPGLGIWAAEHWVTALSKNDPAYADAEESLAPAVFARLTRPQPRFVGWFNLMPMVAQPGEVELGSRLVPAVWGTGLVMDGCGLLLDHAFDVLARDRVWSACHPRNGSAQLRLRMLGFEFDGERPYEGVAASHFVIEASAWRRERGRPLAARRREAMAWLKKTTHGLSCVQDIGLPT
jgi:RimJ/RimL family protein N-acetyltransferase